MKYTILVLSSLIAFSVGASEEGKISRDRLTKGSSWTWLYSEIQEDLTWRSYYVERYELIEENGAKLTFEMSSGAPSEPQILETHHRFIVDFRNCERARRDPSHRAWSVEFYTKNYGNGWQRVSVAHPPLVFTEKFNCFGPTWRDTVIEDLFSYGGEGRNILLIARRPAGDPSWYFRDHPTLQGVAARKIFEPARRYKMELLEDKVMPSPMRAAKIQSSTP